MANQKQLGVLKQGRNVWNEWRRGEGVGKRIDLLGADLRGADLRGANLRGANLREANLREANLSGANLRVADLSVADLRFADLRGADLSVADLRGADLREAIMARTILDNLDLRGVIGLETVRHEGTSILGFATISRSEFQIPEVFLRGVGIGDDVIARVLGGPSEASGDEDSLTIAFHFPPAIRGACEEYLLSFTRFLREVGVEATADLKHEGKEGRVLYSVRPAEGTQALGKIKQALELYLELATVPDLGGANPGDFGAEMVRMRIRDFQNDIENMRFRMKAQEMMIEAQEQTNRAHQALMMTHANVFAQIGEFFVQAQKAALTESSRAAGASEDEIKMMGGALVLGSAEMRVLGQGTGLKINLPQLIKWVGHGIRDESTTDLFDYLRTAAEDARQPPDKV